MHSQYSAYSQTQCVYQSHNKQNLLLAYIAQDNNQPTNLAVLSVHHISSPLQHSPLLSRHISTLSASATCKMQHITFKHTQAILIDNMIHIATTLCFKTSSSAMAERPRELGDFKKARVNGGTNNHSLKDSHKCLRCR